MFTLDEAFEVLHDSARYALLDAQDTGADAFRSGSFADAQAALDRARQLQALDAQITALETEVDRLLPLQEAAGQLRLEVETPTQPAVQRRSRKGLKTPEAACMRPILEVLVDLGGSGDVNTVLDQVYAKMALQLNDHDRAPLASDGVTPRWRNTAQWARNALREQGLLRTDLPRGVWGINEKGRAWLG
jgi:restriction system protein